MKLIPLTKGQFAKVDDEDFERVSELKWCAQWSKITKTFYALGKRGRVRMNRFILDVADPSVRVDHKNHDTLDNTRDNLRAATHAQNCRNRLKNKNNSSGFKGVTFYKARNMWCARICVDYKSVFLGLFESAEEAGAAYRAAAEAKHGEFAHSGERAA
jgi:AP2 domain